MGIRGFVWVFGVGKDGDKGMKHIAGNENSNRTQQIEGFV